MIPLHAPSTPLHDSTMLFRELREQHWKGIRSFYLCTRELHQRHFKMGRIYEVQVTYDMCVFANPKTNLMKIIWSREFACRAKYDTNEQFIQEIHRQSWASTCSMQYENRKNVYIKNTYVCIIWVPPLVLSQSTIHHQKNHGSNFVGHSLPWFIFAKCTRRLHQNSKFFTGCISTSQKYIMASTEPESLYRIATRPL